MWDKEEFIGQHINPYDYIRHTFTLDELRKIKKQIIEVFECLYKNINNIKDKEMREKLKNELEKFINFYKQLSDNNLCDLCKIFYSDHTQIDCWNNKIIYYFYNEMTLGGFLILGKQRKLTHIQNFTEPEDLDDPDNAQYVELFKLYKKCTEKIYNRALTYNDWFFDYLISSFLS